MTSDPQPALSWKALFRVPGFPFFFTAMLISLFGTGMNFAGVTWYVLGATHSTVKVSLDRDPGDAAGAGGAAVWRGADRPGGPALSGDHGRRGAGGIGAGHGYAGVPGPLGAVGTVFDGPAAGRRIRDLLVHDKRADPGTGTARTIDHGECHRAHRRARRDDGRGSAGRVYLRTLRPRRNSGN